MRIVTLDSLRATFDDLAQRGRKGIATMRGILDERADHFVPVESELEARFLDLTRAAGLPEPVRQLDVGDSAAWIGRVDFAYPAAGLLIELDSDVTIPRSSIGMPTACGTPAWPSRVADVRFPWDDVVDRPDFVVDPVRHLLASAAA